MNAPVLVALHHDLHAAALDFGVEREFANGMFPAEELVILAAIGFKDKPLEIAEMIEDKPFHLAHELVEVIAVRRMRVAG